jgi:ABC-type cobalamin/Fe3+-siderophores transport system ATPase subunit
MCMLKQIKFTNHPLFENQKINFGSKLNLIIGENGSGKSSLMKAIGFYLIKEYNVINQFNEIDIELIDHNKPKLSGKNFVDYQMNYYFNKTENNWIYQSKVIGIQNKHQDNYFIVKDYCFNSFNGSKSPEENTILFNSLVTGCIKIIEKEIYNFYGVGLLNFCSNVIKKSKSIGEILTTNDIKFSIESLLSDGERNILLAIWDIIYALEKNKYYILLEEPERSFDIKYHFTILKIYIEILQKKDNQIFITSHSHELILKFYDNYLTSKDNNIFSLNKFNRKVKIEEVNSSSKILPNVFNFYDEINHIKIFNECISECKLSIVKNEQKKWTEEYDRQISIKLDPFFKTDVILPVYIRNAIHHPEKDRSYDKADLKESINFMLKILNN